MYSCLPRPGRGRDTHLQSEADDGRQRGLGTMIHCKPSAISCTTPITSGGARAAVQRAASLCALNRRGRRRHNRHAPRQATAAWAARGCYPRIFALQSSPFLKFCDYVMELYISNRYFIFRFYALAFCLAGNSAPLVFWEFLPLDSRPVNGYANRLTGISHH